MLRDASAVNRAETAYGAHFTDFRIVRRVDRLVCPKLEQIHHQLHRVVDVLVNGANKPIIDEEPDLIGCPCRRVGVPRGCVDIERDAGHVILQPRVVMGFHPDAQLRGFRADGVTEELDDANLTGVVGRAPLRTQSARRPASSSDR